MASLARLAAGVVAALALCALAGCDSPTAPAIVVEPIQIDSVDVLVMESFPPMVAAHVQGVVGDGCSALHSVRQQRSGRTIELTILRQRQRAVACTQIALLFDERVPLEGAFPPGDYLLRVNGVERRFRID